jgi:Cell division protein
MRRATVHDDSTAAASLMRTLCLLLILANVFYFIWSQVIDVQVNALDRPVRRSADAPPRIVLAKELSAEAAAAPSPQTSGVDQNTPIQSPTQQMARVLAGDASTCTSVGPFAELAEAAQAQAALRDAGFSPHQRVEQGELWVGYWVSVQNIETRAQADEALETLKQNGIDDVYLMPGGEPTYTLSLGVFSDYQRAQRRAEQARAVGFDPRIEDRKRAGAVYWLDVELPEPGAQIDAAIFQTDPGKIMRLEMRACPGSA